MSLHGLSAKIPCLLPPKRQKYHFHNTQIFWDTRYRVLHLKNYLGIGLSEVFSHLPPWRNFDSLVKTEKNLGKGLKETHSFLKNFTCLFTIFKWNTLYFHNAAEILSWSWRNMPFHGLHPMGQFFLLPQKFLLCMNIK